MMPKTKGLIDMIAWLFSCARFNGTTGALIGTFASGPHLNFPVGLTFSRPRGRSPITHLPRITPEH